MTEGLEGKGYHIYFDIFFTTERLMKLMYKKEIYCCGTVRSNRKNFTNNLKNHNKLTRREWDWFTIREMLSCVKWKDKRAVTVLSTINAPTESLPLRKSEKDGPITQINCAKDVNDYRRCMGGVDRADMLKSYYAIDHKSRKMVAPSILVLHRHSLSKLFYHFQAGNQKSSETRNSRLELISGLIGANRLKRDLGRRSMSPFSENFYNVHIPKMYELIKLNTCRCMGLPDGAHSAVPPKILPVPNGHATYVGLDFAKQQIKTIF
ncbi:hypothetical protein NQ314_003930 [Rhamnusium bicolor]|uniref:PiggyBac transposable element-derived protein domain-containing protein n=1 Tax=Rhamnusium bicolor TaxID=1586634 RepID=A0AAV8ZMI6_9CUCU|nr:hypothetical protein NQ314_003930 [Rhamnusium bicolor]